MRAENDRYTCTYLYIYSLYILNQNCCALTFSKHVSYLDLYTYVYVYTCMYTVRLNPDPLKNNINLIAIRYRFSFQGTKQIPFALLHLKELYKLPIARGEDPGDLS